MASEHRSPNRPRTKAPWRVNAVILARLPEVERQHLAGRSNLAIAAALGVDEGTIRTDLKRLRELWLERIGQEQETLRAIAVAELADVRQRALAAAAFDERAERAVLYGQDADGTPIPVERDAKRSAQFRGNKAAALGVARQATMDTAKVLGIVVEKIEHDGTDPFLNALREVGAAGRRSTGGSGADSD